MRVASRGVTRSRGTLRMGRGDDSGGAVTASLSTTPAVGGHSHRKSTPAVRRAGKGYQSGDGWVTKRLQDAIGAIPCAVGRFALAHRPRPCTRRTTSIASETGTEGSNDGRNFRVHRRRRRA